MGNSPAAPPRRSAESNITAVEDLLRQIIKHGGFNLTFAVKKVAATPDAGEGPAYTVDFSGTDQDLLLEKNAALLDALESVVFKAVRLDEDLFGKITFDCRGWRQLRIDELKLMAQVAAERVIESGDPFPLNPMGARDRRIIHLALKDQPKVRTQSEGFGPERRVVIVSAVK
ncbi:MAG TPA: R3H domain-containing nucleic acid-binding protein [Terriglobia bacterium]|nr:R3H domain-containing nucleic acid-binding protein [Terriglobia bacterium]